MPLPAATTFEIHANIDEVISLLAGVAFSPHGADWIRPMDYALQSEENLEYINLYFTRLVLGVQLVVRILSRSPWIAGIDGNRSPASNFPTAICEQSGNPSPSSSARA